MSEGQRSIHTDGHARACAKERACASVFALGSPGSMWALCALLLKGRFSAPLFIATFLLSLPSHPGILKREGVGAHMSEGQRSIHTDGHARACAKERACASVFALGSPGSSFFFVFLVLPRKRWFFIGKPTFPREKLVFLCKTIFLRGKTKKNIFFKIPSPFSKKDCFFWFFGFASYLSRARTVQLYM